MHMRDNYKCAVSSELLRITYFPHLQGKGAEVELIRRCWVSLQSSPTVHAEIAQNVTHPKVEHSAGIGKKKSAAV